MGLLDILNSIGSSGAGSAPANQRTGQATSQGTSPMAKAMLGLLAIYAAKHLRRADAPPTQPTQPAPRPGGNVAADPTGGLGGMLGGAGGLGDLLKGPLGGILGGAAAGTVLNGGLGGLLKEFQQSGQGDVAHSWIGTGANKTISEGDLASTLGSDTLDTLSQQTGMSRDDLLSGMRHYLPGFVDQLTPAGRLPTEEEASRMV